VRVVTGGNEPQANLAVQTAVIGGARRFVGTYGGFSYLAPLLGVDALAFYSCATSTRAIWIWRSASLRRSGAARCFPVDAAATTLLGDALGGAARTAVAGGPSGVGALARPRLCRPRAPSAVQSSRAVAARTGVETILAEQRRDVGALLGRSIASRS